MKNLEGNHKAVGAYVDETVLRYRVPEMRLLKRRTKKGDNKEVLVSALYRVCAGSLTLC
jgi:hypothetical protein